MSHKRNQPQYLCSELVSVLYEDPFRGIQQSIANLEEISVDEAVLLAEHPLELATSIAFSAKNHDLYGTVKSCVFDPVLGWFIRIGFDAASRWHGRHFVPEHFLALTASTFCDPIEALSAKV